MLVQYVINNVKSSLILTLHDNTLSENYFQVNIITEILQYFFLPKSLISIHIF